jgi:hypothetical protein
MLQRPVSDEPNLTLRDLSLLYRLHRLHFSAQMIHRVQHSPHDVIAACRSMLHVCLHNALAYRGRPGLTQRNIIYTQSVPNMRTYWGMVCVGSLNILTTDRRGDRIHLNQGLAFKPGCLSCRSLLVPKCAMYTTFMRNLITVTFKFFDMHL